VDLVAVDSHREEEVHLEAEVDLVETLHLKDPQILFKVTLF
jgi:hypothetical protein